MARQPIHAYHASCMPVRCRLLVLSVLSIGKENEVEINLKQYSTRQLASSMVVKQLHVRVHYFTAERVCVCERGCWNWAGHNVGCMMHTTELNFSRFGATKYWPGLVQWGAHDFARMHGYATMTFKVQIAEVIHK